MYRKVVGLTLPSFLYWVSKSPFIAIKWIVCKIRKKDFEKVMMNYHIVNELRKTCMYYAEKDSQARSTISCSYKPCKYVVRVKLRFHKKAKRQDYESFKETLETHTCNVSTIIYKGGYAFFDVLLDNEPM
ncbi:MAG: hypothetical protein EOM11_05980, partial [Erysipelotrichia bacterium]|nr:hypothetical protein [Erysipelotrichia bacterium]